jgi:hypothetical protein
MTIGTSIFLIAAGAILRWAVTATVSGINLKTAGLVLLIVGTVGLILSVIYTFRFSRRPRDPRAMPDERPYQPPYDR